jgi:signal transduction histidine kinase/CheY-like chemotaxis protein
MHKKFSLLTLEKNKIVRSIFIFFLSIVYFVIYYTLFKLTHLPIVAAFSFILLIPITWAWGIRSGFLLLILNVIWTSITLSIPSFESRPISVNAGIGIFLQIAIVLLIGFIRSLYKKLKKENEDRIKAENKLIDYQNKLEQTIKERTEALENAYKKIYQNEKMQAIGQLAGGIAHDYNNKMTIILGYCDMLMKKFDTTSTHYKYLEQIRVSGLQSAELTKQLLAFARKGVYKFSNVNINELVSEVIALITRSFPKNIKIQHILNAIEPFVWGGIPQLQNAILNIALNAKDAMPQGGNLIIQTANLEIDESFMKILGHRCTQGPYIAISLTDTGAGIAPDIQKRIFEPFFTTKQDGKGIGMGLAAVYGTVESHKGKITVNSVINEGTTFTIYIPLSKEKPATTDIQHQSQLYNNNEHILVIDDEATVTDIFKLMLENTGYRVTTVLSGYQAIQIYTDKWADIDLVLIDMSMPDLSGRETFQKLKLINPAIKSLLVSGYTLNEQIELALTEGFAGFIQKPCDRYELHINIQKTLGTEQPIQLNPS